VSTQAGWLEAVANPIRLRIVRHLNERDSASLDELAQEVSAQRNTVRVHLRALMAAGVVARLPGQPEGRLGRPPARYRLERQLVQRAGPGAGATRALRSPVTVVVRDYPAGAPEWTLREPRWAALAYLLETPSLAAVPGGGPARFADYRARTVDWDSLEREWDAYPRSGRLLAELARDLLEGERRVPASALTSELEPEQRARAFAAIALAAGDATVVGVAGEQPRSPARAG
jgi:DNA-binding transcriptional ArsR family regulator